MLNNSTVTGNSSGSFFTGGIQTRYTDMTMNNSIVAGNLKGGAPALYGREMTRNLGQFVSNTNLFGGGNNVFYGFLPNSSDIIVDLDTVSFSTVLSPLADNGGATLTHALPNGSPAVDTGDNAICATTPINNRDQRGETRPFGNRCDIGAFEAQQVEKQIFIVPLPNGKSAILGL